MTQGGYLETARSRTRPLGLSLVIAAHVMVLSAVMLARGEIIRHHDVPIIDREYHADPAPPPAQQDKIKPASKSAAPAKEPIFVSPKPLDPGATIIHLPPYIPTGGTGTDLGGTGDRHMAAPVLVDAQIDPRFAGMFQPEYPSAAQRDGITGKATVRVHIGVDGRVTSVELVRADDPSFYEATARQAMRRWRFTPATRDGIPIESVKVLTVTFVLRD